MALIPILEELPVPADQILWQAKGNVPEALAIAASYGYRCACRDMDDLIAKLKTIVKQGQP